MVVLVWAPALCVGSGGGKTHESASGYEGSRVAGLRDTVHSARERRLALDTSVQRPHLRRAGESWIPGGESGVGAWSRSFCGRRLVRMLALGRYRASFQYGSFGDERDSMSQKRPCGILCDHRHEASLRYAFANALSMHSVE